MPFIPSLSLPPMSSLFSSSLASACLVSFLLAAFYAYHFLTARRVQFPPGPKGVPLIGNILQVPGDNLEVLFQSWAKKYGAYFQFLFVLFPDFFNTDPPGNIVYAKMINQPIVILSDLGPARDLLERRSAIYSDRPRFVLVSEL